MTVKHIQWQVTKLFHNHIYHLYNSYLYSWECDYFSRTKSGNDYEVEIKLTRSDFFADFKKDKHRIFTVVKDKKQWLVNKGGVWNGEVVGYYEVGRLCNNSKRLYPTRFSQIEITESATHTDYLNGYADFEIRKQRIPICAKYSRVQIVSVEKLVVPNCFYYACPEGLIKPEELPPYAGLIYINSHMAWTVKKAPYIHKRSVDLTGTLLSKFYHETVKHRNERRINPDLYKD